MSNDSEIISQIDTLIEGLSSIGLFTSNTTPSRYIQLQIFISRYEMFVKGNIDQINLEIDKITKKAKQWEISDLSLQERLKKGEIDKYIKNALPVLSDYEFTSE